MNVTYIYIILDLANNLTWNKIVYIIYFSSLFLVLILIKIFLQKQKSKSVKFELFLSRVILILSILNKNKSSFIHLDCLILYTKFLITWNFKWIFCSSYFWTCHPSVLSVFNEINSLASFTSSTSDFTLFAFVDSIMVPLHIWFLFNFGFIIESFLFFMFSKSFLEMVRSVIHIFLLTHL